MARSTNDKNASSVEKSAVEASHSLSHIFSTAKIVYVSEWYSESSVMVLCLW